MRILFLHPEDSIHSEPWATLSWDRIIDLGRSGQMSYESASTYYRCDVTPIDALRAEFDEIRKVGELLKAGFDVLKDKFGLDWWELTSILVHSAIEKLVLLRKVAESLAPQDEVFVSRPGFYVTALNSFLGSSVRSFPSNHDSASRGLDHYVRVAKKFPASQLLEIFWDKTDPGYQLRGRFSRQVKPSARPVILAPTAYGNASRTAIAYAGSVPELDFLLVSTRRSGWISSTPSNVATNSLRSYASVGDRSRRVELEHLSQRWNALRVELNGLPEFKMLEAIGGFDEFPRRLAQGLEIRDAWCNVLDREPVTGVLCADDSNPYTHIPLLLAKERGLPAVACHHGALDGRYMFKRAHADVILAKGRMEQDYLVRVCGVPGDKVEIGAPAVLERKVVPAAHATRKSIVFFSEAYEISGGGRAKEFYRDVLPSLADLAIRESCQLVVKLHPAESLAERQGFVFDTLSPVQRDVVRVVAGPLGELLNETWFGVTILSTVAVECATQAIPCFLCSWLEFWPYGYIDQFTRFGVGIKLDRPTDLLEIPKLLASYKPDPVVVRNCSTPIESARFAAFLGCGSRATSTLL